MTRDEALSVLGLKSGATRDEVRLAYRELAQMLHPDKFGSNKRLRERAEQQMRAINEARDVLLKGARPSSGARRASGSAASSGYAAGSPEAIAFEARARANAAETARLSVVAQLRTMRERRRAMLGMAAVAALVSLVTMRMRGTLGMLAFSISSMLVLWGVVDAVILSSQVDALKRRSVELLRTRDAARRIAEEAAGL